MSMIYGTGLATALPVTPPSQPTPTTYTVKVGDTLTRISWLCYNNPNFWRQIADSNNLVDPRLLTVGMQLTIPR